MFGHKYPAGTTFDLISGIDHRGRYITNVIAYDKPKRFMGLQIVSGRCSKVMDTDPRFTVWESYDDILHRLRTDMCNGLSEWGDKVMQWNCWLTGAEEQWREKGHEM
jgi:hypothetical protein